MTEKSDTNDFVSKDKKKLLLVCLGCDRSKLEYLKTIQKQMHLKLCVLEDPNNPLLESAKQYVSEQILLDLTPRSTLFTECIKAIEKSNYVERFDGVFTFWDDAVLLAGVIAEKFNLPGNPISALRVAKNKYLTREFSRKNGDKHPHYVNITDLCDLDKLLEDDFFKDWKTPFIIKPVDAGSSIGVVRSDHIANLRDQYLKCLDILKHSLSNGELMGLSKVFCEGSETNILIEEYIEGVEVDVDIVLEDGKPVFCECTDDWPMQEPWYCETGAHSPSQMPLEITNKIKTKALEVLKTLNMKMGVFHVEIIAQENGDVVLLEVNSRMGGGPILSFHKEIWNVDLLYLGIASSLGLSLSFDCKNAEPAAICITVVCHAKKSGILSIDAEEAALKVIKSEYYNSGDFKIILAAGQSIKGDYVIGWNDGFPTSLARLDISFKSNIRLDEGIKRAKKLKNIFYDNLIYEKSFIEQKQHTGPIKSLKINSVI